MNISVIVPSYNHQDFVIQCLNSVIVNKVTGMELLICDDCSTDNSVQIIEKWLCENAAQIEKVSFVKHNCNSGIAATLNEMIALSSGKLISAIASDDYYLKDGISARVSAMNLNPQWIGACSDGTAIGNNGELYFKSIAVGEGFKEKEFNRSNICKTILTKWTGPMNLQIWRRAAFKNHGGNFEFNESIFCEDLDFALWALSEKSFGYINHQCVAYRYRSWPQSNPQDSRSKVKKKYVDMANCYVKHAQNFNQKNKSYMILKAKYLMAVAEDNTILQRKYHARICDGPLNRIQIIARRIKMAVSMPFLKIYHDFKWWKQNYRKRLLG